MKIAEIEVLDNEIVISSRNRPIFVLLTLGFITLLALIIPIAATVIVLNESDGIVFGILITYIICFGTAIYFLRIILWNLYGKEVIKITDSKLEYFCSYKFFIDNKITIDLENIEVFPTEDNESKETSLTIRKDGQVLETTHLLSRQDLERIEKKIKNAQ